MKRHVDFMLDSFHFDAEFVCPHLAKVIDLVELVDPEIIGDYGALVSLATVALFEAGYLSYREFAELIEVLNHA